MELTKTILLIDWGQVSRGYLPQRHPSGREVGNDT